MVSMGIPLILFEYVALNHFRRVFGYLYVIDNITTKNEDHFIITYYHPRDVKNLEEYKVEWKELKDYI